MGWSMGGPIVLSYFDQFGQEQIKGLGLIDMTPFPFSPNRGIRRGCTATIWTALTLLPSALLMTAKHILKPLPTIFLKTATPCRNRLGN